MALQPGSRLGAYEILSLLGAGGMGEVYRARDTRLDRIVAIKVLPDHLASDQQFRERFDREARTISQLDHPHICALYDVGTEGGTAYLVMQYLEGETLADRLQKGALPIDQAVRTAIAIIDALDKAHHAGIVHRDLKPGNVMLTKAGAKLLDFGLAKTSGRAVTGAGQSMLPTTPPNLTAQGTILGTYQYMAPEQLEGLDADARTDIFAFGAVLYEMLTGRKAFEGKTNANLIGAILKDDPPTFASPLQTAAAESRWGPASIAALDHIVRRCLAKDPEDRWQTARDLLRELKWTEATAADIASAVAVSSPQRSRRMERLAWTLVAATALICVMLAFPATWYFRRAVPQQMVSRFEVSSPPTSFPPSFALSPDGHHLAIVANAQGGFALWIRSLDQVDARPLTGTEGAVYPFWSPDGRAIGFFADGKLKRVDLTGGTPQVVADAGAPRGGAWNRDDVIVFAPSGSAGLMQVAAKGGTPPTELTRLARGQGSHRWPQFLPDGRRFLFFARQGSTDEEYIGSLDGGEPARVLAAESGAAYAPPDYLLRLSQSVLVAHRFDLERGVASEQSFPVARSVASEGNTYRGVFSVSETGVLAYQAIAPMRRQFVWFDRAGKKLGDLGPPSEAVGQPQLAPDGQRLATARGRQRNFDVWIIEIARGIESRLTTDAAVDTSAVWSPDGARIIFRSDRNGRMDLFEKPANDTAQEQPLLVTEQDKTPLDWSSDGRVLLYTSQDPQSGSDLWGLPLTGERKPFPIARTNFDEAQGQLSPNGQWVAYTSNETGRNEVYVRPYPGSGARMQVSTSGGIFPRWRKDGGELFYLAPDDRLMAVPMRPAPELRTISPGVPVALFPTRMTGGNVIVAGYAARAPYDVSSDGRFLMNVAIDEATRLPITVVLNWQEELKRRVPVK